MRIVRDDNERLQCGFQVIERTNHFGASGADKKHAVFAGRRNSPGWCLGCKFAQFAYQLASNQGFRSRTDTCCKACRSTENRFFQSCDKNPF